MAMAGRYLRNLQPTVDLILCSPLLRTRQTADTVQTEVGNVSVFTAESLVSSANPLELLKDLGTRSTEVILLVGHEPHLSKTISLLISGTEQAHIEMRKGTLACAIVEKPIERGHGKLQWLTSSDQMALVS